jgi:hypothetical protein
MLHNRTIYSVSTSFSHKKVLDTECCPKSNSSLIEDMFHETLDIVTETELTQWIKMLREKAIYLDLFKKISAFCGN